MITGTVKPDGLNLRERPNRDAKIIDKLPKGDRLEITDRETRDGWLAVKVLRTGQHGYVFASFADIEQPKCDVPAPPPAKPPKPAKKSVVPLLWALIVIGLGLAVLYLI